MKLIDLILEDDILKPRRAGRERHKKLIQSLLRRIRSVGVPEFPMVAELYFYNADYDGGDTLHVVVTKCSNRYYAFFIKSTASFDFEIEEEDYNSESQFYDSLMDWIVVEGIENYVFVYDLETAEEIDFHDIGKSKAGGYSGNYGYSEKYAKPIINSLIRLCNYDDSGSSTKRVKKYYNIIDNYIKNGSQGDLDLSHCPNIVLRDLKKINGNLDLSNSEIKNLGSIEVVTGKMLLNESKILTLGNLQSVGYLNAYKSDLSDLGDLQYVENSFRVYDTKLNSFGKIKHIGGSIDISHTPIQSLESLKLKNFKHGLTISHSNVKTLGEIKSLTWFLYASHTPLESLGDLKYTGSHLMVNDTPLQSLGNLEYVGGFLDVSNTNIKSFGNLKHVKIDLRLDNSPLGKKYGAYIKSLPDIKK